LQFRLAGQRAWMLPHPAHPTSVTQNCTSSLNSPYIRLSVERAESVKKYLVKSGIAANRILAKGQGSANPIGDNKTKEGRAQNRRVEIHSVVKEQKKVPATE
jgi:outer membrane protein OmpA-like peptidoglycan-associated protein